MATERVERVELSLGELARRAVHDAESPERMTLRRDERLACIEADPGLPDHERVLDEAGVLAGVRHDEDLAVEDRVAAERDVARRLLEVEADARLEPLPVGVDEADQGDRGAADRGRERRQVVEGLLGTRVEDVEPAEGLETGELRGGRRTAHFLSVHRLSAHADRA